jgi:hypothetical protein
LCPSLLPIIADTAPSRLLTPEPPLPNAAQQHHRRLPPRPSPPRPAILPSAAVSVPSVAAPVPSASRRCGVGCSWLGGPRGRGLDFGCRGARSRGLKGGWGLSCWCCGVVLVAEGEAGGEAEAVLRLGVVLDLLLRWLPDLPSETWGSRV